MVKNKSDQIEDFVNDIHSSHVDVTSFWTGTVGDNNSHYSRSKNPYNDNGKYYSIGSCTKPVTALAVLRSLENVGGSIYDNITQYVSGLPSQIVEDDPTIEDLLSHSSGFGTTTQAVTRLEQNADLRDHDIELETREELYNFTENNSYKTESGKFFYYNMGYVILGELIENITQSRFEDFVLDEVLEPYNIDGTFKTDQNVIKSYVRENDTFKSKEYPSSDIFNSEGGLFLSPSGAMSYLEMFLDSASRVLKQELYNEMCRPRVKSTLGATADGNSYCLGLNKKKIGNVQCYTHCGISYVSSAGFAHDGEKGVFTMMNGDCPFYPSNIPLAILSIMNGGSKYDVPYFNLSRLISRVTGSYQNNSKTVTIKVTDSHPYLKLQSNCKFISDTMLIPEDIEEMKFQTLSEGGNKQLKPVDFVVDDGGKISIHYGRFILPKVS